MLTHAALAEPSLQVPLQPLDQPAHVGMDDAIALKMGQLLCSRLCHDLIGPTAAINAGGELMSDEGEDDAGDVRELIIESARQLAGRLTFFRAVFGQAGSRWSGLSYAQVRDLAQGYLHGGRVRFEWQPAEGELADDAMLPGDITRLSLCLIMLAADALPRGGAVSFRITERATETVLSLTAAGRSIGLAKDVVEALRATEAAAVTPRTVHAFYLSCLATRLQANIVVGSGSSEVLEMQARVPQRHRTEERLCA